MQVLDGIAELKNIALNFEFDESLSSSKKLVERLTLTELKQNVNIFSIFEEMLKSHDVLVMKRTMDFDLTHQFLFGSRFGQSRFVDDFGSWNFASFCIGELVTFGKAAFTEELTFDILFDANVAIETDNFLFDNDWITFIVHHVTFSSWLLACGSCHHYCWSVNKF